jgi:serine/threonine-protein kinase RsbW
MRIVLSLSLPREEVSIPIVRHILRKALQEVGATDACTGDIELAQTEACANVVKHSGPGDQYEVSVEITSDRCFVRVIDTGRGFDGNSLGMENADLSAERGRGIQIMRALVDDVRFTSKPEAGTVVHLEKTLEYADGSFAQRAATRG